MKLPDERIVFFLDILGFKDIIESCDESPELIDSLMCIVSDMNKQTSEIKENALSAPGLEVTVMSDSVVVSAPSRAFGEAIDLRWNFLCTVVSIFMVKSCLNGWLVRGAVSKGWLIHQGNKVFGRGLTNAYQKESKVALYPRLIIDPKIVGDLGDNCILYRDKDGIHCIDWILSGCRNNSQVKELGIKIEDMLKNIKSRNAPDSVAQKYYWLANIYNERVSDAIYTIDVEL